MNQQAYDDYVEGLIELKRSQDQMAESLAAMRIHAARMEEHLSKMLSLTERNYADIEAMIERMGFRKQEPETEQER